MINIDFSQEPDCQLGHMDHVREPLRVLERIWRLSYRAKRVAKRRLAFAMNLTRKIFRSRAASASKAADVQLEPLKPGDWVRIRSKEEIKTTLGNWNDLKGCAFMEEMWRYCGTTHQVLKRIERFLDERDYHVKKVRRIVILDRVNCQGTVDFGPCDRNCFFFWREEWLEKVNPMNVPEGNRA